MLTIAWDVDDVLNSLTHCWFDWWRRSWDDAGATGFEAFVENPPHRILGLTRREYLASLDDFRLSGSGASLSPNPEVRRWFDEWGASCRHLALTATPLANAPNSCAWVMGHFGAWVRSYHVIPSPREGDALPVYDETKTEFLAWFGLADVLVDDSLANVQGARSLGMDAVVVPQPWNGAAGNVGDALGALTQLIQRHDSDGR